MSPITLSLEEGSPAIFQCVVLTDMPTNTIVTWEYGLEVNSAYCSVYCEVSMSKPCYNLYCRDQLRPND